MNQEDKKQFATLFYGLAEEYGGKLSKNGMVLKFDALKSFEIEEITSGISWLVKNREKTYPPIPTVKEIIDAMGSANGTNISIEDKAEVQAVIVIKRLKYSGSRDGSFDDPITNSIMTDRWNFCEWASTVLTKELEWWKKDFVKLYKSYDAHVDAGLMVEHDGKKMIPAANLKKLLK